MTTLPVDYSNLDAIYRHGIRNELCIMFVSFPSPLSHFSSSFEHELDVAALVSSHDSSMHVTIFEGNQEI